jgi:hypothetical protein
MDIRVRSRDKKILRRHPRKIIGEFIGVIDRFLHTVFLHKSIPFRGALTLEVLFLKRILFSMTLFREMNLFKLDKNCHSLLRRVPTIHLSFFL